MNMEVVVVVVAEAERGKEVEAEAEAEAEAEDVLTCHERQWPEEMWHAERERRAQRARGQAAGPDGIATLMPQALPVGRECTREKENNTKVSLRINQKKKMNERMNLGPRLATDDATNRGAGGWRCTRGEDDKADKARRWEGRKKKSTWCKYE
jgi:hypothetical protein